MHPMNWQLRVIKLCTNTSKVYNFGSSDHQTNFDMHFLNIRRHSDAAVAVHDDVVAWGYYWYRGRGIGSCC